VLFCSVPVEIGCKGAQQTRLANHEYVRAGSQVCLTKTTIYSPACAGSAFDEVVQIKRECAGVDGCGNPSNRTHFYGYKVPLSLLSIYSFQIPKPHLILKPKQQPNPDLLKPRKLLVFKPNNSCLFNLTINSSAYSPTDFNMRISALLPFTLVISLAFAGPAAYGLCQAGCAAVVTACYGAAGATWGATLGATAPATIIACNSAFGTCSATCAALLLAPTL
jgi:hypothetical protein